MKKKNNQKTRKKSLKILVDFNNFIRDEVVEPGQKKSFNLKARDVKLAIDDEKKKPINLNNALVNDSKGIFMQQIK